MYLANYGVGKDSIKSYFSYISSVEKRMNFEISEDTITSKNQIEEITQNLLNQGEKLSSVQNWKTALTRYLEMLNAFIINNEDEILENANINPKSDGEKEIIIKYRTQQSKFRKGLLNYYGECAVTGCKNERLLIASHIKAFSKCNHYEKYDMGNGLLLISNYDLLFDKYLITFNDEGYVIVSESISDYDLINLGVKKDARLNKNVLSERTIKYISCHRDIFNEKNKSH